MTKESVIEGCLLGCAMGDSIGLPFEGLAPKRIARRLKLPLEHHLVFGRGMVSDDTDHTVFVAQALIEAGVDAEKFGRVLANRLKCWLLCFPAGCGLATLRSIVRLYCGVPSSRSGVVSAGNGAAMRSALIGVVHAENADVRTRFVEASSHITHRDPRAVFGAKAVADLAAFLTLNQVRPSLAQLEQILGDSGTGPDWDEAVQRTLAACELGNLDLALTDRGRQKGVSGYVLETIPAAVAAWFIHFGDFRATIESVVQLGGDTDTVGSIAGSLAGISCGRAGIPETWLHGLVDRPHGVAYLSNLARQLGTGSSTDAKFSWALLPRGVVFTAIVLFHGFLRLIPGR